MNRVPLGDVLQKTESIDPRKFGDARFRYIDVSSVSNATFQIEETQSLIGSEAPSRARKLVRDGDILFATIRPTLKRIAIVPPALDKQVCSTGFFVLRPKRDLNNRWIFYFLQSPAFMASMGVLQKGASYPAVTDGDVRSQEIPLPSFAEQSRIVAILDNAFSRIAIATANAEKSRESAHFAFMEKLRVVVSDALDRYGSIPLSQYAVDITDGDHMPPPKSQDGVPFITIGNIRKDTREIDFSDTFRVSWGYFDGLKSNRKPKVGDVLYTVTGSFGIPLLVKEGRQFCFQRHIGLIRPKPEVDSEWLQYVLLSPQLFAQADEAATGAAQRTVSLKALRSLRIPNVPAGTQGAQSSVLKRLESEVKEYQKLISCKLATLDELKQSLLHQAFSGQL